MPTPAAVEPPTPQNVHLYRAAALAYRKAWREELRRNDGNHKLANPHTPLNAAAEAVARRAPHGAFSVVGGAYHEILMETDPRRAQFFDVFDRIAKGVSPDQSRA